MSYDDKFHHLSPTGIPINPQSWYHQCTNIDTRSGQISGQETNIYFYHFKGNIIVVVNGKVLLEEEISFFRNSYNVRPTSLQGKKYLYCID